VDRHYLNRIVDLGLDPRFPPNLIATFPKTHRLRRIMDKAKLREGDRLFVVLTFDVERNYGSDCATEACARVPEFLASLRDVYRDITIFVEGSLVEGNSWALRPMQQREIEIGPHGCRHELWGRSQWYLPDRPLTLERKRALLKAGIEAFQRAGLPRPIVFRSPNLVADESTMNLLVEEGFRVDSSLPSHTGVLPVPQFFGKLGKLVRIPVTADPTPSLSRKGVLPYYRFRACSLRSLMEMEKDELLRYVSRIVTLQEALGFPPHIVIISHSWEFLNSNVGRPSQNYCRPENFEFLQDLDRMLSCKFNMRHMSMSALAEVLARNQCE
jgi:peptidoglycan/xylan/chitin deacetylase (PgdA/CDA1 family)